MVTTLGLQKEIQAEADEEIGNLEVAGIDRVRLGEDLVWIKP